MLKAALAGGADAVYVPLTGKLAIRTWRDFFSLDELADIIDLVHQKGNKIYPVANGRIEETELAEYYKLSETLADMGADGLVVGSLALVRHIANKIKPQNPAFKIIISSTLGAVSGEDAEFWRSFGADRVIIPRLHRLDDVREYRSITDVELELFTHGMICPVMEGQTCSIPTLYHGKDEDCHSCLPRSQEKGQKTPPPCTFYKNAAGEPFWKPTLQSDITLLEEIVATGINSVKVIPIGKTPQDSETVIRIWREALDSALNKETIDTQTAESEIANCSPLAVDFNIREKCG